MRMPLALAIVLGFALGSCNDDSQSGPMDLSSPAGCTGDENTQGDCPMGLLCCQLGCMHVREASCDTMSACTTPVNGACP